MNKGFTKLRKEILKHIRESDYPLTVRQIFNLLQKKPNLSTVYRALDFLYEQGHIKSVSFSSEAKYYFSADKAHSHFIYCNSCAEIKVFDQCFADTIQVDLEKKYDYKITDHFFYFSGTCDSCQQLR